MSPQVREILTWYHSENSGVHTNLTRLLNHGRLQGTGKLVILPVDQGFEHGPARSFSKNPKAYDPHYHFDLAVESGCSAYAAPLGFLEAGAKEFAGEVPLILKVNNSDSLYTPAGAPISALTSSVEQALLLGCVGVGFTIYPGSGARKQMYEELSSVIREAKKAGLVVVVWAYPRGEQIEKENETALDVVAYAAHIAAQLGAHIIKVKPPKDALQKSSESYYKQGATKKLQDRIRHVMDSAFNGRRLVLFSGGESKEKEDILEEVKGLVAGGASGSIMGRNVFQRSQEEALLLLKEVMDIYSQ